RRRGAAAVRGGNVAMYLTEIQAHPATGSIGERIAQMQAAGLPIPEIWHLFAFKPEMTRHLAAFTQEVMRGPSPLSPGWRELIAAFTSRRNDCLF
ncbi:MAG: hypothetical protein NZO58_07500, partial [Gemmataceae bacterium]|nr:hypothetical protein [Gemmataceae bacterium]